MSKSPSGALSSFSSVHVPLALRAKRLLTLEAVQDPGFAGSRRLEDEVPVRPGRGRAAEPSPDVVLVGAPAAELDPAAVRLEPAGDGSRRDRDAPVHPARDDRVSRE